MTKRKPKVPNAAKKRTDPAYIAELVAKCMEHNHMTSQAQVAERIGVGASTLKDWKSGARSPSYADQYTLESLAGI